MKEIQKLKSYLTDEQLKYYETFKYIFGEGPRRSGRSYALATYFIEKSIMEHRPIRIFDHYETGANCHRYSEHMLHMIVPIVNKLDSYTVNIQKTRLPYSIHVVPNEEKYPIKINKTEER